MKNIMKKIMKNIIRPRRRHGHKYAKYSIPQ